MVRHVAPAHHSRRVGETVGVRAARRRPQQQRRRVRGAAARHDHDRRLGAHALAAPNDLDAGHRPSRARVGDEALRDTRPSTWSRWAARRRAQRTPRRRSCGAACTGTNCRCCRARSRPGSAGSMSPRGSGAGCRPNPRRQSTMAAMPGAWGAGAREGRRARRNRSGRRRGRRAPGTPRSARAYSARLQRVVVDRPGWRHAIDVHDLAEVLAAGPNTPLPQNFVLPPTQ